MEQRKLIQHGTSSLTIALPSTWIKNYGLKKGDSLFTEMEANKVIFSTTKTKQLDKITVNVSNLDRTSLLLYIQSLYRFGYNEIEINFDKPTVLHHRTEKQIGISAIVHQIVNRCIGAEVIEQSDKRIHIKVITRDAEEDFTIVLRRIFLLLNEAAQSLLEAIKRRDKLMIQSIEEKHDNINKFNNYSLRLLNKFGYPNVKKTCLYYHIIASIDEIVDILKYNARDILEYKKPFHKDTITIWNKINQSIKLYYDLFYNFSFQIVNELSKNRDHIKLSIKKHQKTIPQEELILITNMKQILEIILDLSEFRMALEN